MKLVFCHTKVVCNGVVEGGVVDTVDVAALVHHAVHLDIGRELLLERHLELDEHTLAVGRDQLERHLIAHHLHQYTE